MKKWIKKNWPLLGLGLLLIIYLGTSIDSCIGDRNYRRQIKAKDQSIAEKERKKVKRGDWIFWHDVDFIVTHENALELVVDEHEPMYGKSWFPLWQEHDCLEWLRDEKYRIGLHWNDYGISVELFHDKRGTLFFDRRKQTMLEALLRAVLAVMEGK